jgi:hypothetical protein
VIDGPSHALPSCLATVLCLPQRALHHAIQGLCHHHHRHRRLPRPPVSPPIDLARRHLFEMSVILRTVAMNQAQAALANALVAVVGGTRLTVSHSQVVQLLARHCSIRADGVQVKCYSRADFHLVFATRQLRD